MSNLETRLAEALSTDDKKPSVFSDLLIEADEHLLLNEKEIAAVKTKIVDPLYPIANGKIGKSALENLQFERERLQNAIPILKERYRLATRRETQARWLAELTPVLEQRNATASALIATYRDFLAAMLPLLAKAEEVNHTVRRLRSQTSGIDGLPLIEEIVPRLLSDVRLPNPNGGNSWPTPASENAFAVAMASTMAVPRHDQRYSADWAEAKKAEDKAKLDYWEKRNAFQAEQQAEAKREFEKSKQQGGTMTTKETAP